jgi:hypothetical protein
MAPAEVIRSGVYVAVAFLLGEISTLLGKEKKKTYIFTRKWIRKWNQFSASGVPTVINELVSKDRKSHKKHLRISSHTSIGLYNYILHHPSSTSRFCSLPGYTLF